MSESRPESYWPHLYWLTVLEEQKSYTRAAEKLGISKSAISQKISELERVTGKTLVHRTTRSVSLSDDGLRLGSISPSATVDARRSRIPTSPGRCVTPRRLPSRPPTIFAAMAARRPPKICATTSA